MEISELKKDYEEAWDEYVFNHNGSTFYHQVKWKNIVMKSYGHKPYYLIAIEDGKIRGLLPIFLIKNLLSGTKLVSSPYSPYGGAIGDNSLIENLLIEHAVNITKKLNADYLELRFNIHKAKKFLTNNNYVTLILKLDKESNVVWDRFSNKIRNAVRKSIRNKLEISSGNLKDFYSIYASNMRDLGAPVHDKNFFYFMHSEFGKKAEIFLVKHNDKPIAGAIILFFKDTVISGWAASDKKYSDLNPNNYLYWNVIKASCERGYTFFDFGRSVRDSGTYRFKKAWGAEESQLEYVYYLNKIKGIPDTSQINKKRMIFARVWKKIPISITNNIGPFLRKSIP